ncbi:MAG: DUF983 domain-containing protein [Alphaproteobacteria bacterium]|jgi:uncharacterized protein (DUF983 family)|nr:DUF983 domain-containing protein [Alphaproteobacteria bacterium]MDP7460442.1 DUF983 domain-containing protein [Alphaproteobacteria bacterium]HJM94412.1 DUF983 domain-containing protein [Alphaproteobacteria bacterium]
MSTAPTIEYSQRRLVQAMGRGALARCPACGQGAVFGRYLKVNSDCTACGLALHHHRADDAPPYFTMLILGHVLVPLTLILERAVSPPLWLHFSLWLPLTLILSVLILPRIKGALIGFQWAHRMHGFAGGAD